MDDKIESIDPNPILENFLSENKDMLTDLEKNREFLDLFKFWNNDKKIHESLTQSFVSNVLYDETLPAEEYAGENSFLNNELMVPINYKMLRNAGRTEAARLIKNTRRLNFTEYSRPSFNKKQPGLTLSFKDDEYKPSVMEKQELKELTIKLIDNFFFVSSQIEPDFNSFLGVCYEDFFDIDDITFEIRRSKLGMPLGFHIVDPILIHHIIPRNRGYQRWDMQQPKQPRGLLLNDDDGYRYMFIKNGRRLAKYKSSRMSKSHFFVSSNWIEFYRGYSIVEQGIRMLMNIVKSLTYNSSNFDNNRTPMGMLAFTGGQVNRITVESFKRILYAYLSGAANRYRLPVIGLPERGDAKFIPFNSNSKEMEYHMWITLLFTIFCQLSGTNPEEVSMSSHEATMTGKKLFDQRPDGIIQVSRDKGLNTFLRYIAGIINKTGILKQITGYDLIAKFNGLEVEDETVKINVQKQQLTTTHSYNDIMKENGQEPQTMMYGDMNIYDVKGVESAVVQKVIDAKIAEQAKKLEMQQAQEQQESMSEGDQQLTEKFGEPVE